MQESVVRGGRRFQNRACTSAAIAVLFGAVLLSLQPLTASGQQAVVETDFWVGVMQRRKRQLETVDLYVKRVQRGAIPGLEPASGSGECSSFANCDVVQVTTVTNADGTTARHERLLSSVEVSVLAGVNPGSVFLNELGSSMVAAQLLLNEALGLTPMQNTDMPQWLDPAVIGIIGGMMATSAADATQAAEDTLRNSEQVAQSDADQITSAIAQLEPAGTENVGGIDTELYSALNLDFPVQTVDGESFEMTAASIWIDPVNEVIVKHRFEGTATGQGESRDFFIETINSDFRNPPGCGEMYEPYRRVMRMGGMLDAAQMAEMEEARVQLAEFEQQMASMPAQQRQMMERMMGPQMETMRSLVNGGAIENAEQTEEILCNPDLASLYSLGGQTPGADDPAGIINDVILRQIQLNLTTLGYAPGNTDGILDTLTSIAISQFQAEQGLMVTGEPSAELASLLASMV